MRAVDAQRLHAALHGACRNHEPTHHGHAHAWPVQVKAHRALSIGSDFTPSARADVMWRTGAAPQLVLHTQPFIGAALRPRCEGVMWVALLAGSAEAWLRRCGLGGAVAVVRTVLGGWMGGCG